jgi:hypothetical protein
LKPGINFHDYILVVVVSVRLFEGQFRQTGDKGLFRINIFDLDLHGAALTE